MKKFFISIFLIGLMILPAFATDNTTDNKQDIVQAKAATDVFSKDELVSHKTFPISVIDKKVTKQKDALVIFTPLYGKSTETDLKGYEAVIINNRVVKMNQNNSFIPKNGYVISGHGKAKKFITRNLFEGADVEIDFKKNEIKVTTYPANYIYEAAYHIEKAKKIASGIDNSKIDLEGMNFYINKAEQLLKITKKSVQFNDFENAPAMAKDSMLYADKSLYFSLLYDKDEFKGVTVFPYQKNEQEIIKAIDILNRLGIDNIFLEVYYNGSTIYKSAVQEKYDLAPQNRYYADFDPIETWIKFAKEENKNIYLTFNTFNLGYPPKSTFNTSIIKVHPEWLLKTNKNSEYYLDPANEQVHQYLLDLYTEAGEKYNVSGINLANLKYPTKADNKQNIAIKDFVNKVTALQRKNDKLKFSFEVYPYYVSVESWDIEKGTTLLPVLTFSDEDFTIEFLNQIKKDAPIAKICPIYTEPYREEKPSILFEQLSTARSLGIKGIVINDLDSINKEYLNALKLSVFNTPNKEKQADITIKENNEKAEQEKNSIKEEEEKKEAEKNGTEIKN